MGKYPKEYFADWQRENRKNHREQCREKERAYYKNLKINAMNKVGGLRCCNCGCDIFEILEINHIEGGGRQEHVEYNNPKQFYRDLISEKLDISKYNVLCRVCNAQHYVEKLLGYNGHEVTWRNN